ncbi:NAD(P)-binding protein [Exidia glandulosa HHB12029]|uniref:NAD(P)-binding protein n=1 Tax=Exidia glandulosa HHB12029 TaxID=1314781 RepID=A0A165BM72_EXIGL|nr:NAD(P)-binding protein [Exidia glandulosa HHB12029]
MAYVYIAAAATVVLGGVLYLQHVGRAIAYVPPEALAASPKRFTDDEILETVRQLQAKPIDVRPCLGPRTGRRYIVVGGSGFVGQWMVLHLLARGEDALRIRILDLRAPSRKEFVSADGVAHRVEFIQTDITDPASVQAAFNAPWLEGATALQHGLTVFHAASLLRYIERAEFLLPPVTAINVRGTENVIAAARAAGATVLVYTSSGSVGVRAASLWVAPWQSKPANYFQQLDDRDLNFPTRHTDFFANYAVTKAQAEKLVKDANAQGGLHTASVRPSNGVYGSGGDSLADAYLYRETNPTWIEQIIQNSIYGENCSIAHLQAESALLSHPDKVGGNAYYITDPNPPIAYGDMYRVLSLLSGGRVTFPPVPAGFLLAFAHVIEFFHLLRARVMALGIHLPPIPGELVLLQPSTFALTTLHLVFDDSRARKSPEEGGIGYRAPFTTMQGLCWTALLHEERRKSGDTKREINTGMGGSHIAPRPARADTTTQIPLVAETAAA